MQRNGKQLLAFVLAVLLFTSTVAGYDVRVVKAASDLAVAITHPEQNMIKLSWSKVSGAEGYHIYQSASEQGTYRLVATVNDTKILFSNLKADTNYYFKVVSYQTVNGKVAEGRSSGVVKANANRVGIDVSHHQGKIDWKKVKESGIEFAMLRTSDSTNTLDRYFEYNIQEAKKVGMPVGAYIYSRATTEEKAIKEAELVLKLVGGQKLEYPITFDIEDSVQAKLSKTQNGKIIKAFCDRIQEAGYDVMVYSGYSYSQKYLSYDSIRMYDLWIARYNSSYTLNYPYPVRMFQYTSTGSVSGISGNVDMNFEFDLQEAKTGMCEYNAKTDAVTYTTAKTESLSSIASKAGVTLAQLIMANKSLEGKTSVGAGTTLSINPELLTTPEVNAANTEGNKIKLTWDTIPAADGYEVYQATASNGTYKKVKTVTQNTYTVTGLAYNTTYYYKVTAYRTESNGQKETMTSQVVSAKTIVPQATNVKVTVASYNSNKITWTAKTGATGYMVYRATSKTGTYTKVGTTKSTSYTDSSLKTGQTYYYKITSYAEVSGKVYTATASSIVSAKPVLAKVTNLKTSVASYQSLKLTWSKVSGATSYYVYRATSKTGTYKKIATTTTNSYSNTKLNTGSTYYYKVVAVRTSGNTTIKASASAVVSGKPVLSKPAITKITTSQTKIALTWNKVSGASGYELYRATSSAGTYKKVKSVAGTSFTNINLTKGKKYYYKVRAYRTVSGKTVYSSFSAVKSGTTKK